MFQKALAAVSRWSLSANVETWHAPDDQGRGKAGRLCPCNSDVDLFSYGEGIVDLDAEIPDGALDLGMSQQKLHGT